MNKRQAVAARRRRVTGARPGARKATQHSPRQSPDILAELRSLGDPQAVEGMARFGIETQRAYGVSVPTLRRMARDIGTHHALALQLWSSRVHEARILASMIDDPSRVTARQMEGWAKYFYSWDVCDQCCGNLFARTPLAYRKAVQ